MEVWFAPLERAWQSGYSSRSQFCFLRGKALIQIAPYIVYTRVSAYRSRKSLVSDYLYQTCLFSYPSTLGDFGLFQDVLRILSVGYLSAY